MASADGRNLYVCRRHRPRWNFLWISPLRVRRVHVGVIPGGGGRALALSVLLDARDHLEAYGSRAADSGTPQRDTRFMMQHWEHS